MSCNPSSTFYLSPCGSQAALSFLAEGNALSPNVSPFMVVLNNLIRSSSQKTYGLKDSQNAHERRFLPFMQENGELRTQIGREVLVYLP